MATPRTDQPTPRGSTSPDGAADRLTRFRIPLLVGGAVLVGLVVAVRSRPITLYDDAAITFRYAHRIAAGDGWTYNDGDRTNGASAPLYTMLLAALKLVGFNLITAARIVTTACCAASVGMAAFLGARIAGLWAGALSALFLITWIDFTTQSLSGMESALAVALGLAVIICLDLEHDTWAGVFLGLALVNKLDAGMLAVAVAVAVVVVRRRPPWRIVGVSAAVLAPWVAFAWVYFGSPLPYSFTQKVTDERASSTVEVSRTWVLDSLQEQRVLPFVALAAAAAFTVPALVRRRPPAAVALVACIVWPLLHALAYTVVDLGDPFPWYLTALYAPLAIAAACAVVSAIRATRKADGAWQPLGIAGAVVALGLSATVLVGTEDGGSVGVVVDTLVSGHEPLEGEAFEKSRRDAAIALASMAEPDDVIATCFGWFAFEAIDNPISEICPLSTREPVGTPRWYGTATFGSLEEPAIPEGATIVETFVAEVGAGGRADVVRLADPTETQE